MLDIVARTTQKILDILGYPEDESLRPQVYEAVKECSEPALKAALPYWMQIRHYMLHEWDIRIEMTLCQQTLERRQHWDTLPPVEVTLFEGVTTKGRVIGTDDAGEEIRVEFDDEVTLPEGALWPSYFGCLGGLFKANDVTFLYA